MESINKRITYYREKAGYTKRQMAEKMGLKYTTYCRLEDNSKISDQRLKMLSKVLEIDEKQLLYEDYMQDNSRNIKQLEEIYNGFSSENAIIVTDQNEKRLVNLFRKCTQNKKYAIMECIYYMYTSEFTFTE